MAWHLQIGMDEALMKKVDAAEKTRQKFIYSMLVIMIIIITLLVLCSSVVYLLIIFHNWSIAIGAGLFISFIVFNLYRFLIITAINAERSGIGAFQIDHEKQYQDFINKAEEDIAALPEESIRKYVNDRKDALREKFDAFPPNNYKLSSSFLTMTVRVVFLTIIAMVFSTGLELLIFKSHVNEVLNATAGKLMEEAPDSWMLKNMLTPETGEDFILFKSNSLLLTIDVLQAGLGKWKLAFDILFIVIFLLPLVLVFKSREIQKGVYVRELALHEISISFYHYLKTRKYCSELLKHSTQNSNSSVNNLEEK